MSWTGTLSWTGTTGYTETESGGGGVSGENGWIAASPWTGTLTYADQVGGDVRDINIISVIEPFTPTATTTPGNQLLIGALIDGPWEFVTTGLDPGRTSAAPDNDWDDTAPASWWSGIEPNL